MSDTNRGQSVAKVAATLLALGVAAGALTACNTMSGMGKDVSSAGSAVTGTSQATQKKIPAAPAPTQ